MTQSTLLARPSLRAAKAAIGPVAAERPRAPSPSAARNQASAWRSVRAAGPASVIGIDLLPGAEVGRPSTPGEGRAKAVVRRHRALRRRAAGCGLPMPASTPAMRR